jgi:hypothetical protein
MAARRPGHAGHNKRQLQVVSITGILQSAGL